jgi:hypothetical protein
MNNKFLFIIISGIFTIAATSADTIIPAGYVSGTWTVGGSPYQIQGNITIHADSTLRIEPGVEVEFQGDYGLTVIGLLEAIGTQTDTIYFFPENTNIGWGSITFNNAPDSSHLVYCSLRNAGERDGDFSGSGGIVCSNSNPVIMHCNIYDNTSVSDVLAGGITISNNSSPEITHCTFNGNFGPSGGCIAIYNSNVAVTNCSFTGNGGIWGGGVYLSNSQATLTDCEINNAWSGQWGGGIYGCENSTITLTNCIISDNSVAQDGGGIYLDDTDATLINCSLYNNDCQDAGSFGGGIGCFNGGSTVDLFYCTFWNNYAAGSGGAIGLEDDYTNSIIVDHCTFHDNNCNDGAAIYIGTNGQAAIHNSIFSLNLTSAIRVFGGGTITVVTYTDFYLNGNDISSSGSIPANFGVITTTNANGDSCDQYYNIFEEDPMFADKGAGNFQITWANFPAVDSTKSPCIDAGDPNSPLDPDSTITDMGAYWFDQSAPSIVVSDSSLNFGSIFVGNQAILPLTVYNIGNNTLELSNIFSSLTVFTTNWNPAQNLIVPGDSLEIMIYFTPNVSIPVIDTLYIENNDQLCSVVLTGEGIIQPLPFIALSDTLLNFGIVSIGQHADSVFTIYNIGTDTLVIFSITNNQNVFTHNYNDADSLILSGDSITISITFTPVDTNLIADTLLIENNDKSLQVTLIGKGNSIEVGIKDKSILPKVYALYPAYPNPFNPSTTIEFDLPRRSFVTLNVYNILGQEVSTLIAKQMNPGRYRYIWNAKNLASGIYFYRINANEFHKVKKIILLQ